MIVVIADDFTGAAEVGGIAWRHGFKTVLQRDMNLSTLVDVLIIDIDSRSKSEAEAIKTAKIISKKLIESKIDWIFKKVDSVLRGHIISELNSMISELKLDQVLMIANNPSVGRIIRQRRYYINDREIHKTDFKHDPQFPIQSSEISEILGKSKTVPLKFLQKSEEMKGKGIFIPEIVTKEDIVQRVCTIKDDTLLAGGSDFFEALLEVRDLKSQDRSQRDFQDRQKSLIVMASTTDISRKTVLNLLNKGVAVCNLPCQQLSSSELTDRCLNQWINDIRGAFKNNYTVISAILHPLNKEPGFSDKLNHFIADMVRNVLRKICVKNLMVEGGATVSSIINTMGWNKFKPLYEYSKAVIRLEIEEEPGCTLIVKPGSYAWPDEIIKLIN